MPPEFPELVDAEQERALHSSYVTAGALGFAMLLVILGLVLTWGAYFGWRDQPVDLDLDLAPVEIVSASPPTTPAGKYLYLHTFSYDTGDTEDENERCRLKMNPVACASHDFYADIRETSSGKYTVEHIYTHLARPPGVVFGLFGYIDFCGGLEAELIASLPHRVQNRSQQIVIDAVDLDGSVIATFGQETYRLLPGQSWVRKAQRRDLDCSIVVREERITNYGWIDEEKITWNLH